MTLEELNEAVRRDIFNQLDNKVIYTDPDSGKDITLQLAKHLDDDRDNGEARGDHIAPNEMKKVARVGIKKLISQYGLDRLVDGTIKKNDLTATINFKMKTKLKKKSRYNSKTIKVDQFSTLVVTFFNVGDRIVCKILTIYKPRRDIYLSKRSRFNINI